MTQQGYLVALSGDGGGPVETPNEAPSALVRLIDSLQPTPAYVLGPRCEVLACNDARARLAPAVVRPGVNVLTVLFGDEPFAT